MSRTCGECTLCCKLLRIPELEKPAGSWCGLVQIGRGCGSYAERPESCRAFECAWLVTPDMPESFRPDRIKAVLDLTIDGKRLVVHLDPATPDQWRNGAMLRKFIEGINRKTEVIIVAGDKRKLLPAGRSIE